MLNKEIWIMIRENEARLPRPFNRALSLEEFREIVEGALRDWNEPLENLHYHNLGTEKPIYIGRRFELYAFFKN